MNYKVLIFNLKKCKFKSTVVFNANYNYGILRKHAQ